MFAIEPLIGGLRHLHLKPYSRHVQTIEPPYRGIETIETRRKVYNVCSTIEPLIGGLRQ